MPIYLAQHYLDNSARLFPTKTAAVCGESKITWVELYNSSNRLANCLLNNGVSRQDRVAFYLKRSINSVIAIAAILKADAIYVPIDSKSPFERFLKIITDCKPSALICDGETVKKIVNLIPQYNFFPRVFLMAHKDELPLPVSDSFILQEGIDQCEPKCPGYRNIDTDIAYILYTSGSTGDPKGVMISHLNIVNYIEWAVDCFEITERDKILTTAPFHFDMSTFDIYCSLKSAATLCIAPESILLFPGKLLELIETEEITIWKGVSSLLMYIARSVSLGKRKLPTLKKILFAGETLPTKYLIDWMKAFPEKQFYNAYGPTEATGVSTYYQVPEIPWSPTERIPIGTACGNTEVFLLKEDNSPAQVGEHGELCIRGSGLSTGYWNDRKKTEAAFVTNPLSTIPGDTIYRTGDIARLRKDGNYEFIGRKDDQIKYMGYRIDLSEIESAIISIDKVRDAAAILHTSERFSADQLFAFVVQEGNAGSREILSELSDKLPPYMLPKRIVPVTSIPRNDRGKIDRNALEKRLSES